MDSISNREDTMNMPEYKELSKDIGDVKVTVERIETTLKLQNEPMKGFMKDLNRRMDQQDARFEKMEAKIARIDDELDVLRAHPDRSKAKWFDEVAKYILVVLLGYIAFKLGLK